MKTTKLLYFGIAAVVIALTMIASPAGMSARQTASDIKVDADDIGGVVTSSKGPEAGVWVIAETTDLPTRLIKIVVTDDRGRCPICQRRITTCGCAATAWWIRQKPRRRPAKL